MKLLDDAPQQISILETLNEASESPLTKEPEESLDKSTRKATPLAPTPTVAISTPTVEVVATSHNATEKSEPEVKEKPLAAAVAESDKPIGEPQATDTSAAVGVDSSISDTALDEVKKRGTSAEKKKLRRIRTNSQVETII